MFLDMQYLRKADLFRENYCYNSDKRCHLQTLSQAPPLCNLPIPSLLIELYIGDLRFCGGVIKLSFLGCNTVQSGTMLQALEGTSLLHVQVTS
jgi:hypothetical protein